MPRVSWKTMAGYEIALPDDEQQLIEFDSIIRSLLSRLEHNIFESRTLAELRDTLLPKLISGEIRVPAAEEAVEAVS